MMILKNLSKVLLGLVLFASGCSEFIEPSIEKEKVVLLSPADGTEGNDYSQTFWWEEVPDAFQYRLQVVMPDFNKTVKLVLDTVVQSTKFRYTLDPGNYQWRVSAQNGSSATPYTLASFVVHPSTIEEQQVQVEAPANNLVSNQNNTAFRWLKLFGAERYRLQIDTNNFEDESVLFFDRTTTNLEFTVSLGKDKLYRWRVRAENETMESKWSPIQNLTLDRTPPTVVFLTSPTNNQSVARNVNLQWEALSDAKRYQLYVFKSDGTSLYSGTFPLYVTAANYTFSEGKSGEKVFWQVRALDESGNAGAFSEARTFTIQ